MWVKGDNKLSLKNTNEYGINLLQQFFYRSLTKQYKTLIIYGINCEIWPKRLQPPAVYDKKFTDVNQMLDHSHGTYIYLIKRNGSLLLNMHSTIYPMRSMDQDPNFHVSVPSGWAKLGTVFHVHICPMHYLSHYRPFELSSFHVVITNFDYFTFRKTTYFFFQWLSIHKNNLSSMVVSMKCNCNKTRGYQFWLDVSVSSKKAQIVINIGKISGEFTTNGNMNAFCALNIDVTKSKFGQKLQHSLLHQLIFTYCWCNYHLSGYIMMNHQKLPLPPK